MTMNQRTQAESHLTPERVRINAFNPTRLCQFYQDVIGLDLMSDQDNHIFLGIQADNAVLLEIYPSTTDREGRTTGLFHMAFLLPTRKALADSLRHLITVKAPLQGASDHGYSEALYLADPEGNGIEIYWDKDQSVWDKRPDGFIEGITIEIDADGLLALASDDFQGFPSGTKIGHVHLSVKDLASTERFYHQLLGLGVRSDYQGQALFLASGGYHHHLGANIWAGRNLPAPKDDQIGLNAVIWTTPYQADLDTIEAKLKTAGLTYHREANHIKTHDYSGLALEIHHKA